VAAVAAVAGSDLVCSARRGAGNPTPFAKVSLTRVVLP